MRNGKFAKKGAMSKTLVLVLSLILVIGCVTGGTLAWLLDKTPDVKNTFTPSTVNVKLEETTGDEYQMVPGWTIAKDPKATVVAGSEECLLFIKVTKAGGTSEYGFDAYLEYTMADGWTALDETNHPGVYWREIDEASDMGVAYSILKNDQIKVKDTVTKEMMDALATSTVTKPVELPTLTFTAYAHQLYKNESKDEFTAAEAWANLNSTN